MIYDSIKRISQLPINDKKVLMRVDFNVPLDKEGQITSHARIDAALESINYCLENNCKQLILTSHLGRPKKAAEKGEDYQKTLSLAPVAQALSEKLGQEVALVKNYREEDLPQDKIILLENIRFNLKEETAKEGQDRQELAKRLGSFADIYINEAFGTCHRKHASVYDIVDYVQEKGVGFLIEKEITQLAKAIDNPKQPFVAILGGAKVEDKIAIITELLPKVEKLIEIGAMCFSFIKAQGGEVGESLCVGVEQAQKILQSEHAHKIILPKDMVCAQETDKGFEGIQTAPATQIPAGLKGLDIGPETVDLIRSEIEGAQTIFWNGPAGLYEEEQFRKGSEDVALLLAHSSADTIIGGGDSVTVLEHKGLKDKVTHASTGGGASLTFLETGKLPALDKLQ